MKYCLHYQKHGKSLGKFKFILWADQDPIFNYSIYIDVMYIDGNLILYVIDEATYYQASK
jgi:hypothetical protein